MPVVKVTIEFNSYDQAIVALGKIVDPAREAKRIASLAAKDKAVADAQREVSADVRGEAGAVTAGSLDTAPVMQGQAAPAAQPKRQRKPRADKGQKREPYGPRATAANAEGVREAAPAPGSHAPSAAPTAEAAPQPTPEPIPEQTAAPVVTAAPTPPTVAQAPFPDAQTALEALFAKFGMATTRDVLARFGVQRLRDLAVERHPEFIAKCSAVLAGESV